MAEAAIEVARANHADSVIGIGGGSNLDVAKVVAIVLKHGGRARDYFGFGNVPGPVVPLIAIPTTAGTGSEISHSAVLTDTLEQVEEMLSPFLRPSLAIVDSKLNGFVSRKCHGTQWYRCTRPCYRNATNRPNEHISTTTGDKEALFVLCVRRQFCPHVDACTRIDSAHPSILYVRWRLRPTAMQETVWHMRRC